ncbi:MAG: phytoene desaturase [Planctomycetes bacterium]|nr:phytoene desaturase [Planctomycetota bacterium]
MGLSNKHVVVVGAGLAGLAASVELASRGIRVTLVDQNRHAGGKMNVLREGGFSFDMGPTILTLPQVLAGIIRRSGRRVEDYIQLVDLDPQWRCFYEDGTVINLRRDVETMARQLDQQFPLMRPGDGYKKFIGYARRMQRLSEKVFYYKDLEGVKDMMFAKGSNDPAILKDVLAMRMHSTVAATAHGMINEPHLRQLVEHFMQYVGSSPFLAPAILSLIASAQTDHGVWYSMGGTRKWAEALERIAGEIGVEFVLGEKVARITTNNNVATGVNLANGREIKADAVLSNCDVQRTYTSLVGTAEANSRQQSIARKYTPACSGVVLYLGLNRRYEHLAHHNFIFSKDSRAEFEDIYTKGIPAADPTLYLAVPSRTDEHQAPPGGEALYILVHTAYQRPGQIWEGSGGLLERYKPVIMAKLRSFGMQDIDQHIVVERHLSPAMIDTMYNAEGGAIYGLASHGKLAGGFKPRNRCPIIKGLYLGGGSTNPGPGVPMVTMSGVTAARCVLQDFGATLPDLELGPALDAEARTNSSAAREPALV